MPFQALPIALRDNPGTPVSKLAWIYIVQRCSIQDAPNGMAWLELEVARLADFCQCTEAEAVGALELLRRQRLLGLISWKSWTMGADNRDEALVDVVLPVSQLHKSERKRIKASPDEIDNLLREQEWICVTCGVSCLHEDEDAATWHVDHIIPRSVGGADVARNCQAICPSCNRRKGSKLHFLDFLGVRE